MAGEEWQWQRSPDYRSLFSNHFRFRFGPEDGNITFSEFTDTPGSDAMIILQEHIRINMSLGQIKMLGEYINVSVQEIESQIGPIRYTGPTKDNLQKMAAAIVKNFPSPKK